MNVFIIYIKILSWIVVIWVELVRLIEEKWPKLQKIKYIITKKKKKRPVGGGAPGPPSLLSPQWGLSILAPMILCRNFRRSCYSWKAYTIYFTSHANLMPSSIALALVSKGPSGSLSFLSAWTEFTPSQKFSVWVEYFFFEFRSSQILSCPNHMTYQGESFNSQPNFIDINEMNVCCINLSFLFRSGS